MTAADSRRLLPTVGWFLAGFLWLWLVSALADAALSSVTGVLQVVERSRWAESLFLLLAAFTAAIVALAVARHPRWGAGTLRATWIVGFIDIVMGVTALAGAGSGAATASLSEGAGYLAAAAVFSVLSPKAVGAATDIAAQPGVRRDDADVTWR